LKTGPGDWETPTKLGILALSLGRQFSFEIGEGWKLVNVPREVKNFIKAKLKPQHSSGRLIAWQSNETMRRKVSRGRSSVSAESTDEQDTKNLSDQLGAKQVIGFIQGTAIADLRSLVDLVRDSRSGAVPPPSDGQLNFALALVALIVCEACGFYLTGASRTPEDFDKERSDLGTYVMEFIQKYFPSGNLFKLLDKVLADFLRHALVHGYGSYSPKVDFDLALFISVDMEDKVHAVEERGKRVIELNSLALANDSIRAFEAFKDDVIQAQDADLLSKIARARDHDVKVSGKIANQFNVVFDRFKKP
jgi:hypothetical protein